VVTSPVHSVTIRCYITRLRYKCVPAFSVCLRALICVCANSWVFCNDSYFLVDTLECTHGLCGTVADHIVSANAAQYSKPSYYAINFVPRNYRVTRKRVKWITDNFSSSVTDFLCFLHLQPFLSQLGLTLFPIALKMNELRSTTTGLASSTLPLTLILARCDQLVRAPHSHATTAHGDCKITVQFSHGFFPP
jgi:hypothetical protein